MYEWSYFILQVIQTYTIESRLISSVRLCHVITANKIDKSDNAYLLKFIWLSVSFWKGGLLYIVIVKIIK